MQAQRVRSLWPDRLGGCVVCNELEGFVYLLRNYAMGRAFQVFAQLRDLCSAISLLFVNIREEQVQFGAMKLLAVLGSA